MHFFNLISAPSWYMKFCGIFFGALAYILAYSCSLREIMRKICFKRKFMGEISVFRNWNFWNLKPFLGIKKWNHVVCARTNIFTLLKGFNFACFKTKLKKNSFIQTILKMKLKFKNKTFEFPSWNPKSHSKLS